MLVSVYTYQTIHSPNKRNGAFTYVLETIIKDKAATITKTDLIEGSECQAELSVAIEALGRINKPCDVRLVIENQKFMNAINNLPRWAQNGWKNSKGEEIRNVELWQQLWEHMRTHNIEVQNDVQHEYRSWMHEETDRKERA